MQVTRKAELARQAIMGSCSTCKGYGCRDCAARVERINVYANSQIPVEFWDYDIETFPGDTNFNQKIKKLAQEIDGLYHKGKSFALTGKYGLGKTFGATFLLKEAIKKSYSCRYTAMKEIVNMTTSREESHGFTQALLLADFVCIDEIDSKHIPTTERGQEMFASSLEYIIRSRFQNKLPIIFCTNNGSLKDVFSGAFEQTFNSLFSERNVIHIAVGGVDLR